uniref:Uncharacterized protein n=1 Tax=Amphora coffeiformis TaxID=265554 RepID=A0A7S3L4K3_9STRA
MNPNHNQPSPSFHIRDPGFQFPKINESRPIDILERDLDSDDETNVTDVQEQDQEGAEEVSGDTGELSDDDADVPDVQEQNQEGAEKALGDKGGLVGIKDDDGQVLGYASADDDDDDDDKLESLRKIFTCAPQLAEVSSKSYMMSLETKTNLKWGIRWIKFDTQENVKDMVRHLLGIKLWGPSEELLHDITLFVFCQKLGITCSGGKRRLDMLAHLREFRDPDRELVLSERSWQFPNKYKEYFGLPL